MGKRKGELLSLTLLLFVFMLTTAFFYMVYSRHYDSASDDFTGFTILNYESEPGILTDSHIGSLPDELDEWARKHRAVLFYKGFFSAGIAAVDYADWFEKTWHVPFDGQEPKTVIVKKGNENLNFYKEGDILFPKVYDYRILGEFDGNRVPTFQGDSFFYFPLTDLTEMQGLLFTNITDEKALAELTDIIEKSGRAAEPQTLSDSGSNLFEVIIQMLMGDFITCSMLFAFLGLVFCAVFAVSILYRESNRYMKIHHLYGATYGYLFLRLLVRLIIIALLGTVLGYGLGKTQLHLIHKAAYVDVALLSGICNLSFIIVIQSVCFFNWKRKAYRNSKGKEGR